MYVHVKDPVVHVRPVDYGNTNIPSVQHSDKIMNLMTVVTQQKDEEELYW